MLILFKYSCICRNCQLVRLCEPHIDGPPTLTDLLRVLVLYSKQSGKKSPQKRTGLYGTKNLVLDQQKFQQSYKLSFQYRKALSMQLKLIQKPSYH